MDGENPPATTAKRRPPKRDVEEAMKVIRAEIDGRLKRKQAHRSMATTPVHDRIDVKWCERQALANERAADRLMKVWVWMGDACNG